MNSKVLFVHDSWLGLHQEEVYGIHYTNMLVERYSYFGKDVTFLTRGREIKTVEIKKYSLLDHPNFSHLQFPNFRSLISLYKKRTAKTIIQKAVENHDIIIIRLPSSSGRIALAHAKKLNKPFLVEFVTCTFDSLWNYDWRGKLLAPFKYYKAKKIMLQTTHTVYVTEKFLQSRYPSPGKSIGCSDVELPPADPEVLNQRLQKIKKSEPPLKLITVGAVDVAFKGQADVIKALAILKQKNLHFDYDIIGQGNPKVLQKLINKWQLQDRVKIRGPLPHTEVFKALATADVYVQPSKQEGLPRAVIEAMSMGLPVIGADTGGIPELIASEAVYKKRERKALEEKLKQLDLKFLEKHATLNFEKAKVYQKQHLDKKRKAFYDIFKKDYGLS